MRRFSKSLIALFITIALALSGSAISPASTTELPQVAPSGLTPHFAAANPAIFDDGIQNTTLDAVFNTISCLSAGNCIAAGSFSNSAGDYEAFTQTETNGNWAKSEPAIFDPGIQYVNSYTEFRSVSCPSAGNCVAAGSFKNAVGGYEAFTQTQTNGTWAKSEPATFDDGIQNATPDAYGRTLFNTISCPSAGNCVAAGSFTNFANGYEAFTQTQTDGIWAKAVPASFDSGVQGSSARGYFQSVSCPSAGNCVVAGKFENAARQTEAFTQSQTGGVWAKPEPATFEDGIQNATSNAETEFYSVSCSSVGNCVAAGSFINTADGMEAFTQTQTGGIWAKSEPATFYAGIQNLPGDASGRFDSVSCPSAGNCVAAGRFTNAAGHDEAFTQTETNGTWAKSEPATFSDGIQSRDPYDWFESVSCSSAGNCVAAGSFADSTGRHEAFTQTQTNGTWAKSEPATFNDGIQNVSPSGIFYSVSCPSTGNCVAAGTFYNATGGDEAFTQNISKTAATPKLTVAATAKVRFRFQISSSVLTKTQKTSIKKMVTKSGKNASFTITGCAGKLPGVTDNQAKALAKKRGKIVKAYLIKLGVEKSHIKIKVKITNQGIAPKTKILARYLTT